ncbi:MAG: hypothetical protein ACYSWU_09370 [Planctomycetota bacterium]|jgi:hypothetical protein
MLLIVFSPAAAACFCSVQASRHIKPDSDWRMGKLLLPRHVTSAGRPWLLASFLLSLAFVVLAFLSPLIVKWLE